MVSAGDVVFAVVPAAVPVFAAGAGFFFFTVGVTALVVLRIDVTSDFSADNDAVVAALAICAEAVVTVLSMGTTVVAAAPVDTIVVGIRMLVTPAKRT